jgi:hypothetical protein
MGLPLAITVDGGQLYAQAPAQERFLLSAMAVDEFFYDPDGILVSFKRDAAGKLRYLMLHQDGHDFKGELQPPK